MNKLHTLKNLINAAVSVRIDTFLISQLYNVTSVWLDSGAESNLWYSR